MVIRRARRSLVAASVPLLAAVALTACTSSQPAAPRTAAVVRSNVTAEVSASGSFAAVRTQNLGFQLGGHLTSLKVHVGDQVKEGQLLATIDGRTAKHALAQAEANLAAQQAGLARAQTSTAVSGSQSSLNQANSVVSATRSQVAATADADRHAVDRAKAQLSVDKQAKRQADSAVDQAQAACAAAGSGGSGGGGANYNALLQQALQQLQSGDPQAVAAATQTLQQLSSQLADSGSGTSGAAALCSQLVTLKAAQMAAKQRVVADQTAVIAAQQKKKVDAAAGKLAVESAQQGAVAAQNGLNASSADRPNTVAQQQALVDGAEAGVASAQQAVDDTKLKAPAAGTIAAINGAKGEYLGPASGATAQAPGSRAAVPGAASAGGSTSGGRSGSSAFIVLSDVHQVQFIAPFEQSDAAQLRPGMQGQIQADSAPGGQLRGTVVAVAPTSTVSGGAISFTATLKVSDSSGLADGETGRAAVTLQQRKDVLAVPNAAVSQQGDSSTVVLLNTDGTQQTVPFEAGVVGSELTEVRSGLSEGQQVVLPNGAG